MTGLEEISSSKCFGGQQKMFKHDSQELGCKMKFSLFLPSTVHNPTSSSVKLPVVYYLGGILSTEETLITETGVQRPAEQYKLIVVGPDSKPRGLPDADETLDDILTAGYYVDAILDPWKNNYRMYSYVTKELKELVERSFPCVDGGRAGIMGHSMGGHGALISFFRLPQLYKAVSAIAPVSNPIKTHWGKKCLIAYLGPNNTEAWKEYDATELVKRQSRPSISIKISQGSNDETYDKIKPRNFVDACHEVGQPVEYTEHDGYDHGSYFISTVIESHLKHHADLLYGN